MPGQLPVERCSWNVIWKKANYSFIDAHVETLKFERTFEVDPNGGFPPKFLVKHVRSQHRFDSFSFVYKKSAAIQTAAYGG